MDLTKMNEKDFLYVFGDNVIGKIEGTIKVNVTERMVEDILCGCFEGGSSHWVALVKDSQWYNKPNVPVCTWATKLLIEGKSFTVNDFENPEDPETTGEITLNKFIGGLKAHMRQSGKWDVEDYDAEDYDCILQLAAFDEVIFG